MHITISITAPQGVVSGHDIVAIDVGPDMTIGDLKAVIQSDTTIAPPTQILYHNGRELSNDSQTLSQCQIKEDDMLALLVRSQRGLRGGSSRQARTGQAGAPAQSGRRQSQDPEYLRLQALGDPMVLQQIRTVNPELADAVQDPARFKQVFEDMERENEAREAEKQRKFAQLNEDPFNPESQATIEEMIREDRVRENLQDAMDYNPEVFGRVHMLYIDVEVNNTKVKAFVDSGAQATIMSPSCAEKCGIMRLIDKRFAGIARGVGIAKILGRVHVAQIKVGGLFLPCSFTVMEGKDVDLLLGLDMLKRHQACIDLKKGALVIDGEEVKFLGEADIPRHEEDAMSDEPSVKGPAGMKTGAISGAVSKDPSHAIQTTGEASGTAGGQARGQQASRGGRSFPPEDIAKLTDLGFSRDEAIHALELADGNVDVAAGILL